MSNYLTRQQGRNAFHQRRNAALPEGEPVREQVFLPFGPYERVDGSRYWDWQTPLLVKEAINAFTAPGRAYLGQIPENRMVGEAANFAMTVGAGSLAGTAPTNALRSGLAGKNVLSMDNAARMERAASQGFDTDTPLYHGTLRQFDGFQKTSDMDGRGHDGTYASEGHHGAGIYLTTSPADASHNYANKLGPDQRNKIDALAERLETEGFGDNVEAAEFLVDLDDAELARLGDPELRNLVNDIPAQNATTGDYEALEDYLDRLDLSEIASKVAEIRLMDHDGLVIPVVARGKNLVRIKGKDETIFDYVEGYNEELDDYDEATGAAVDLIKATVSSLRDEGLDLEADELSSALYMEAMESGGLSASDFESIVRRSTAAQNAIDYELSPGMMIQDGYRALGYDGIEMRNPGGTFQGMQGMGVSDKHYVIFDPKNVRSRFAKFDPENAGSSDLLSSRGVPLPPSAEGARERQQNVIRAIMSGRT